MDWTLQIKKNTNDKLSNTNVELYNTTEIYAIQIQIIQENFLKNLNYLIQMESVQYK